MSTSNLKSSGTVVNITTCYGIECNWEYSVSHRPGLKVPTISEDHLQMLSKSAFGEASLSQQNAVSALMKKILENRQSYLVSQERGFDLAMGEISVNTAAFRRFYILPSEHDVFGEVLFGTGESKHITSVSEGTSHFPVMYFSKCLKFTIQRIPLTRGSSYASRERTSWLPPLTQVREKKEILMKTVTTPSAIIKPVKPEGA